jgi:hypothetical protein
MCRRQQVKGSVWERRRESEDRYMQFSLIDGVKVH